MRQGTAKWRRRWRRRSKYDLSYVLVTSCTMYTFHVHAIYMESATYTESEVKASRQLVRH
jgi:hypothetical protein